MRRVSFGAFELDLTAGELRKAGVRLHVPKQSLDILRLLIERQHELVGRDDIRQRLWPNGEVVEFEHSINTAIRRLRDALGESAASPRLIETIPGRGYRLLVPVQSLEEAVRPPMPQPEPSIRAGKRGWREWWQALRNSTAKGHLSGRSRGLLTVGATFVLLAAAGPVLKREQAEPWMLQTRSVKPLAAELPLQMFPVWSPDGKRVAFLGGRGFYDLKVMVQGVDSNRAVALTGPDVTLASRQYPFWSHDSQAVYFFGQSSGSPALHRVGLQDLRPVMVQPETAVASLSPDGRTLVTVSRSSDRSWRIYKASPPEGQRTLYEPEPLAVSILLQWPNLAFSPDASNILAEVNLPAVGLRHYLLPWPPTEARSLFPKSLGVGVTPHLAWLPDSRHAVYVKGTDLLVADTQSGRIWSAGAMERNARNLSVSPDGAHIAYQLSLSHSDVIAVPLEEGPPRTLLGGSRSEEMAACSPTGETLVYGSDRRGRWELWISSFDRQLERPLITDEAGGRTVPTAAAPAFSPDGQRVAFRVALRPDLSGLLIAPVSGGAPPQVVVETPLAFAPQWSPDGKWLVYIERVGSSFRLAKIRIGSSDPPVDLGPVAEDRADGLILPEWSPTGEWIAYDDPERKLALVSPDRKVRRVLGGGGSVAWARDGKTLYQLRPADRSIVAIDVGTGVARVLRHVGDLLPYATREPGRRLSLTPDGKSVVFSVLRPREEVWLLQGLSRAPLGWRTAAWFGKLFSRL